MAISRIGRLPDTTGEKESPLSLEAGPGFAFLEQGAGALAQLPVKVDLGGLLKGAELQVAESIFKLFLANHYGMDAAAQSSIEGAYNCLRPLVAFTKRPPWKWTPNDIALFMTERRATKDIGHSRQYQYAHYFRKLQNFLLEDLPLCNELHRLFGVRPQPFVTKENSIPLKQKGKKRKYAIIVLTPEEVQRIGDEFDAQIEEAHATGSKSYLPLCRDKTIFWLLYHLGFRMDEVLKLTIHSFQPDRNYPAFGRYAVFAVIGKGSKDRYPHALDPSIRALMDWYMDEVRVKFLLRPEFEPSDPTLLFFSERGGVLGQDQFRRSLKRVSKAAGVTRRVHPHLLRHTNVTELIPLLGAEGTQQHVGHAHMGTTMGYYHRDPDKVGARMQDAIQNISDGIQLRDEGERSQ